MHKLRFTILQSTTVGGLKKTILYSLYINCLDKEPIVGLGFGGEQLKPVNKAITHRAAEMERVSCMMSNRYRAHCGSW